jgi:hypothetical protein
LTADNSLRDIASITGVYAKPSSPTLLGLSPASIRLMILPVSPDLQHKPYQRWSQEAEEEGQEVRRAAPRLAALQLVVRSLAADTVEAAAEHARAAAGAAGSALVAVGRFVVAPC